uniref:Uncharacterized protein n=1 Tax=Arundo donax TaxID=35708 RepID=A0A0A9H8N9_ARUDO
MEFGKEKIYIKLFVCLHDLHPLRVSSKVILGACKYCRRLASSVISYLTFISGFMTLQDLSEALVHAKHTLGM